MKARFFTLLAILLLIIIGFVVYLNLSKDRDTQNNDIPSETISPKPTNTPTPTVTPTTAPISESVTDLYPASQEIDGKKVYGYIDSSGTFVIKPAFDEANDFHSNYAIVYMDEKYLAIDTMGNIFYTSKNPIGDFYNDTAIISRYGGDQTLYGYINKDGKEIIKPQYELVSNFGKEDTAYVYSGKGKYALINKLGKTLESYELDSKYNPLFIEDGYVIYYNSKGNYGVVKLTGEEIIKDDYSEISYIGKDLFALKAKHEDTSAINSTLPAAFYDSKGTQLTDYLLYDISSHNGYISTTDDTFTYFIGPDGQALSGLPKFEGRGTVTMFGDVIKADIDGKLAYYKKDYTLIWQEDTFQTLSQGIIAKEIKFKHNKYAYTYYPRIEGLSNKTAEDTINVKLRSLFVDSRKDLLPNVSVADTFKASIMKNLLVVERNGYDYPFGAAHGMPIRDCYYMDINSGSLYEFKDLFIADSDYVTKINEFISTEIAIRSTDDDSMYFDSPFNGIPEKPYFKVSTKALTIYFYPYDIAAYAAGFVEFEISFQSLYDYIDFNGAFWNAFK